MNLQPGLPAGALNGDLGLLAMLAKGPAPAHARVRAGRFGPLAYGSRAFGPAREEEVSAV
jgi:hypothetical protein